MSHRLHRRAAAALLFSSLLLGGGRAWACSVCGCADPLVSAGDSSPTAGRLRVSLDFESLSMEARNDESPELTESLQQLTLRPVLVFSPLDRLNLVLQVPLVRKSLTLAPSPGGARHGGATGADGALTLGLGDVDAGARYFLSKDVDLPRGQRQELAVSAGTSLPTGDANAQVEGVRLDDHAQVGTGAFGPYAGLLYAWHRDPWNLSADVYGRTRTANRFGYRYGDALIWNVEAALRPWDRVAFVVGVDGRYAGRDTVSGELLADTGGLLLAATPGVMVNLFGDVWLHARAQLPFFAHLFGEQRIGPTFLVSLLYDPK